MTEYEKFLQELETFIFVENKPEKVDIIFVPGNGYPPADSSCGNGGRYNPAAAGSVRFSVPEPFYTPGYAGPADQQGFFRQGSAKRAVYAARRQFKGFGYAFSAVTGAYEISFLEVRS